MQVEMSFLHIELSFVMNMSDFSRLCLCRIEYRDRILVFDRLTF